ncbi:MULTISPECIES: VOC family protein [unclassified Brevibacterium]|uniref:VOC family protein n=1 Tax=unclassified Brevibacterium TaxID=2614124 RepID=UPI00143CF523|nr:VOC family protein [Brevibacterium sp. S22]
MSHGSTHPIGAPFWIETLQPSVPDAVDFYTQVFGWTVDDPGGSHGPAVARLGDHRAAGICAAPEAVPPTWLIHVRVDDIDDTIAEAQAAGGSCLLPSLDRGNGGRVAVIADSSGVPFCVNDGGAAEGVETSSEPGAWSMASLHAPDREAAQTFYGAVFGWQLEDVPGAPFSRWSLDGRTLGLLSVGSDTPPHWAINIAISDADDTATLVESLGGTVILGPFDTESHRNVVIADPAGAVLACSEWLIDNGHSSEGVRLAQGDGH